MQGRDSASQLHPRLRSRASWSSSRVSLRHLETYTMNSLQHTDTLLLANGLMRLPAQQQPPSMGWPSYLRSLPALPAISDLITRWPGLKLLFRCERIQGDSEEKSRKKTTKRPRSTTNVPATLKVTKVESAPPQPASISAFLELLRTIEDKKSVRRREYASSTRS